MTRTGEDMVMVVRLQHGQIVRERAEQERKTQREQRKERRTWRRLHRLRQARAMQRRRRAKHPKRMRGGKLADQVKMGLRLSRRASYATRIVPILGWALLANDAAMLFHDWGRRISGGLSSRLVQLQDNAVTMGDFIPQAAAAAATLAEVESDRDRLRVIGEDSKLSDTLTSNLKLIRELEYHRAVGADMIRRDPHFDSADTTIDKLIKTYLHGGDVAELKDLADRVAHKIRTERGSRGKGR